MASMNANLILAGQPVNVLGNYSRGMAVGQQANEIQRENALANLYKAQGAGIASGDQGALNALAQHDPMAALKVQGARQTMDIQQQENARADERLGMAREAAKRAAEQHIASLSAAERQKERETLEAGLAGATQIQTPEQWDAYMQQNGLPQLAGRFGERDILIAQALGVKDALEMNAPEKPADEYQRYVQEQESKGEPAMSRLEYNQAKKGNGFSVTTPDGTTVQYGGPAVGQGGQTPIGKAGQNTLDTKEIDSRTALGRLERIEQNLIDNPKILDAQSLGGQLKTWGLTWKDFATGGDLTEEQATYLADVTTMRGDVLENLNYTIKEITGAAMTEAEAKRIGATLPGIDDGPTVFKAKLDRALNATRMAVARYNYWRNNGLEGDPQSVGTLSDMAEIISDRAKEIYQEELANGDPASARQRAAQRLTEEFGIE